MRQNKYFLNMMALVCVTGMLLTGCGGKKQPEKEKEVMTETVTETETAAQSEEQVVMNAVIEEIEDKIIVLKDDQGALYQIDTESSELKDNQGAVVDLDELEDGQHVEIVYNGITMRNLPATIPMVTSFTVVK